MKSFISRFLVILLVIGLFAPLASAGGCGKCQKGKKNLVEKFFKKAHMIFRNQKEFNISEEQIKTLKELKIGLKKEIIRKKADIEIIGVDIKSMLWNDPIDVKAINKLIDSKYDVKKAKMKAVVKAHADVKALLSDEQKTLMKAMCKRKCGGQKCKKTSACPKCKPGVKCEKCKKAAGCPKCKKGIKCDKCKK